MPEFLQKILDGLAQFVSDAGVRIVGAILLVVIGFCVSKAIAKRLRKPNPKRKLDESVCHFLASLTRIGINALVLVSAAIIMGVPSATFITVLGSCGLAVGLALQGSLSNLAGSVMILIFKPFRIGDFIEFNGISGTVVDITFFYTILDTPDNKKITCPNGAISNDNLINYSANDTRRVDLTFGVGYGSDIKQVKEILTACVDKHELVLKDPAPAIRLANMNESSLDFSVKVWCKGSDYWTVHFDLIEAAKNAFAENNIEIPFPQMDVHVKND